jgi:DUF1680 family protein
MEIKRTDGDVDNIRDALEMTAEWIERVRYEICDKDETPLQNTIDEIVRLYQHTQYMLTLE